VIIDTFSEAFRGCGTTLQAVVASGDYQRILEEEYALDKLEPTTLLGTAWRIGVIAMNILLNLYSGEDEIMETASRYPTVEKPSAEIRALTRMLGKHLIQAADSCLPDEAKVLANEWRSASVDRQIEICSTLMRLFQSKDQGEVGYVAENATLTAADERSSRVFRRMRQGRESVLPTLYGTWNQEDCVANCQGKSQMLTAFAQRAGANVVTINTAISAGEAIRRFVKPIQQAISYDLIQRGLFGVDSGVQEGMLHALQMDLVDQLNETFHMGVALELSDGTWFMLDPNGRSYGVISDASDLTGIHQKITTYRHVLPGLSFQTNDKGELSTKLKPFEEEAYTFLRRSREVEVEFTKVTTLLELVRYLQDSPDLALFSDFLGVDYSQVQTEVRQLFVMAIALNCDPFDAPLAMIMQSGDQEFLTHRKQSWLTLFHAAALHRFTKTSNKAEFIHPVFDVSLTEWSLAVSALNTVAYDIEPDQAIGSNITLAGLSADQTTLNNILRVRRFVAEPLARAAHQALESYAIRHPIADRHIQRTNS